MIHCMPIAVLFLHCLSLVSSTSLIKVGLNELHNMFEFFKVIIQNDVEFLCPSSAKTTFLITF